MRHRVAYRGLGRTTPHRKAMFRNMVVSLIHHGRIQTTLMKAKELKRLADRVITWGKNPSVASRRHARRLIADRLALQKLFTELAPRFAKRNGGYTRLLKLHYRQGDGAPMALLEYLDNPAKPPKPSKSEKPAKKAKK